MDNSLTCVIFFPLNFIHCNTNSLTYIHHAFSAESRGTSPCFCWSSVQNGKNKWCNPQPGRSKLSDWGADNRVHKRQKHSVIEQTQEWEQFVGLWGHVDIKLVYQVQASKKGRGGNYSGFVFEHKNTTVCLCTDSIKRLSHFLNQLLPVVQTNRQKCWDHVHQQIHTDQNSSECSRQQDGVWSVVTRCCVEILLRLKLKSPMWTVPE